MDLSRITLRPYRSTDVDDLLSWASDDRVTRSIHFSTLTSKEDALTFIDKSAIPWRRSICIDDRSIGIMVARPGSGDDRCRADIGYALAVEYWGQGITSKAVKMAIPLILEEFAEIIRLQALADAENKASQRVLEKAGFLKEARPVEPNLPFISFLINQICKYGATRLKRWKLPSGTKSALHLFSHKSNLQIWSHKTEKMEITSSLIFEFHQIYTPTSLCGTLQD